MIDWVGRTLGKVHLELLLARGGIAEVYLGMHTTLQRPVAVKLLREQYQDDLEMLERFQREARVVARLRHPNIVQIYDFDAFDGQPYLVMEYVPGLSLSTYLHALHQRGGRLELPVIARLLAAVADALNYAHEMGVIHRDVKPGNILLHSPTAPIEQNKPLPADVQPFLTDFGLVRLRDSLAQTASRQVAGTPAYMSPEQARGDKVDTHTDVYSLGVVLYEMLAGHVPFESDSTMGVVLQQIHEAPPPIRGLSPALQKVLDCALAKQPEERYETPLALAEAFSAALAIQEETPTMAPITPKLSEPDEPLQEKSTFARVMPPVLAGLGMAAVVLVAILLMVKLAGPAEARVAAVTASPTAPPTAASTPTPPAAAVIPLVAGTTPTSRERQEPVAELRFEDASGMLDSVALNALGLPDPGPGNHYEAWLLQADGQAPRNIGRLTLDARGQGQLHFADGQGGNLLEHYSTLAITVERGVDRAARPGTRVAYQAALPSSGLAHVRSLLVSFLAAPGGTPLARGLVRNSTLLDETAQQMVSDYRAGNEKAVRREAEAMLNLLSGSQSPDHRDWDRDGTVADPGDGFGLLPNGDHAGYIEGTFQYAGYAATAEETTQDMITQGVRVEACMQNMEQWAPQLADVLKQILSRELGPQMEPYIAQAAALASALHNGTDLNHNGEIEPIAGEGGALTAYQYASYMADITVYASK